MNKSEVSTSAPHPEEMRGAAEVRVGNGTVLQATFRATPAGLVSLSVLASAVILSTAALIWAVRRQP